MIVDIPFILEGVVRTGSSVQERALKKEKVEVEEGERL